MRRGLSLATSLLVACSFSPNPNAAIDGGLVTRHDAAGSGDPDAPPGLDAPPPHGDLDGDGIENDVDNCPTVPNPDQSDKDQDGSGDACDSCPQVTPNGSDSDGDHIGASCDPHPTTAGDKLLAFDPLLHSTNPTLPDHWAVLPMTSGSAWSVASGAWNIPLATRTEFADRDTASADHSIDVTFTVADVGSGTGTRFAGVYVNADGSAGSFESCEVALDSQMAVLGADVGSSFTPVAVATDATLAIGVRVRIQAAIDATGASCRITVGSGAPHVLTDSSVTSDASETFVGLVVKNVAMTIDDIALYTFSE